LLRADSSSIALPQMKVAQGTGEQPSRPVVSTDGRSVSWVTGTTMYAATLTTSGLTGVVSTPVPTDSFAVSWLGRVVMVGHSYATGCCGTNHAEYDVWDPAKGSFVPHWTRDIDPMFGSVPVGVPSFVRVTANGQSSNDSCLVRVDGVASMAPTSQ